MPIQHIQTSFATGEWAPTLNARVDQAKYHTAAALLENFYVDYRGGASSRAGTEYILQAYKSSSAVRLIPFQASFTVSYVLEFGDFYIRFYNNGDPVLESSIAITGASNSNPVAINAVNTFAIGNWVYITGMLGMTELNNKYFIIRSANGAGFTLNDLYGNIVNSSTYGVWTSGGTVARVYTIPSPYAAADLALLKFAQNVNNIIFCHPDYSPSVLTLVTANNWTIVPIAFGATLSAPTGVAVTTTLAAGTVNYAYAVTAVDINGQESSISAIAVLASRTDIRSVAGTNTVSWTAVPGAVSYNVYRAQPNYTNPVPAGSQMGFIGNCLGTSFIDSNIIPDYSETPPVSQNPFLGAGVASITVTLAGAYSALPSVTIAAPTSGSRALAQPVMKAVSNTITQISNSPNFVGDIFTPSLGLGGMSFICTAVDSPGGEMTAAAIVNPGAWSSALPANPLVCFSQRGTLGFINVVWGVGSITLVSPGSGYLVAPAVTITAGSPTATATTTLAALTTGNPSVPSYHAQRLFLAGPEGNPQQFNFSKPAAFYNFDNTNPIQEDDAIQGTLVSGILNTIKAAISMPPGLIVLCDRQAWLLNNGNNSSGIDPINIDANAQSYNGSSDVPPIVVNFDILYVQAKGSIVRDLTFNFYTNIFTGSDITILSSHLFYGYQILEWAYCEEPFKLVWCVRNDGVLLCLTFMKEQELIGWAHSITDGLFKSVCSVTEQVSFGSVDALYTVVERTINGQTLKYIERMAERIFPNGAVDAWCVDAGLQYSGAPATSFTGGEHLAGETIVGLADGVPISPFVMAANGNFTLPSAASVVTVGLGYTCDLQTLAIDLGEPTIQGEEKKITGVTVRVADTLGLEIGESPADLVVMDDLVVGNVGKDSNERVTDLVTTDALQVINSAWTVPGQYYIRQSNPLPASILGVIPQITTGSRKS